MLPAIVHISPNSTHQLYNTKKHNQAVVPQRPYVVFDALYKDVFLYFKKLTKLQGFKSTPFSIRVFFLMRYHENSEK